MRNGYVISDLHLLAHRSDAARYADAIRAAAGNADFFVLNGDIFDFRWSTLPTLERSVREAVDWLRAMASDFPGCRFFFILGNHDSPAALVEQIDRLEGETPNFVYRASHLRIGTSLFLHGDLVFGRSSADPFRRERPASPRGKSKLLHAGYRAVVATRVHRVASAFVTKARCARRILRALERDGSAWTRGLTAVYFGHMHLPFSDFGYRGVTFHNTGSAIRGMRFRMLPVRLPADAEVWP